MKGRLVSSGPVGPSACECRGKPRWFINWRSLREGAIWECCLCGQWWELYLDGTWGESWWDWRRVERHRLNPHRA